jgi:hypothetical protein
MMARELDENTVNKCTICDAVVEFICMAKLDELEDDSRPKLEEDEEVAERDEEAAENKTSELTVEDDTSELAVENKSSEMAVETGTELALVMLLGGPKGDKWRAAEKDAEAPENKTRELAVEEKTRTELALGTVLEGTKGNTSRVVRSGDNWVEDGLELDSIEADADGRLDIEPAMDRRIDDIEKVMAWEFVVTEPEPEIKEPRTGDVDILKSTVLGTLWKFEDERGSATLVKDIMLEDMLAVRLCQYKDVPGITDNDRDGDNKEVETLDKNGESCKFDVTMTSKVLDKTGEGILRVVTKLEPGSGASKLDTLNK